MNENMHQREQISTVFDHVEFCGNPKTTAANTRDKALLRHSREAKVIHFCYLLPVGTPRSKDAAAGFCKIVSETQQGARRAADAKRKIGSVATADLTGTLLLLSINLVERQCSSCSPACFLQTHRSKLPSQGEAEVKQSSNRGPSGYARYYLLHVRVTLKQGSSYWGHCAGCCFPEKRPCSESK